MKIFPSSIDLILKRSSEKESSSFVSLKIGSHMEME